MHDKVLNELYEIALIMIQLCPMNESCGELYFEKTNALLRNMLAQRPITLVLMMINLCSYITNDLVFISLRFVIKILVGV